MNSDILLENLINQTKSNDVDVKVDALTKLQAQFESGIEIDNPDIYINIFKNCLKSSNQHLTNASVYALPPLLPLLINRSSNGVIDASTLRVVLTTLLPLVFERLGDKDRVQVKARDSVALIGSYSLKLGVPGIIAASRSRDGKGPETPAMIFERLMKEVGLASKVWKIREQSILALVQIRRSQTQFPIRPYLSLLVSCLEDTDAHVRECARSSVVELFTGPGVTDAARADLKKEMTKKGVRKGIVDDVLTKLLNASTIGSNSRSMEGSEKGDGAPVKKEYIPPSLMLQGKRPRVASQSASTTVPAPSRTNTHSGSKIPSRPASRADTATPPPYPVTVTPNSDNADVQTVFVASTRDLENEFAAMAKSFEGKETEHNWAAREQAILRVRGMIKGDVHLRYTDAFLAVLKEGFMQWSLKTLASLRTTVTTNTCHLYSELAFNMGTALDPHCDLLLTHLLKMAAFTKKIAAQQSQSTVTNIITHTSAQPRTMIPLLWITLQEKTVQARAFVVGHFKTYLQVHGQRAKNSIESSGNLEILDKTIRKALGDPNPAVREAARKVFWDFYEIWPENGKLILGSLDAVALKQLEKVCPSTNIEVELPPITPRVSKKSSVAAAIAASRAKAKAIATAPPTLRHQATSASHNLPTQKRSGSPSSPTSPRNFARPASPLRVSSSPPNVRSTASISRTTTLPASSAHSRTPSSGYGRGTSPISSETSTSQRSVISPSSTSPARGSTLRKAMQTALPASPPLSSGQLSPTPKASSIITRNVVTSTLPRHSTLLPQMGNGVDESLLMAQTVPIPLDEDSEDESSINLMSFSSQFHKYGSLPSQRYTPPKSRSPKSEDLNLTPTVSNAMSSGSMTAISSSGDNAIIEDALKARAEQAESAAERLLELVEPEMESESYPSLPPSLLTGSGTNGTRSNTMARTSRPPVTPANKSSNILKQAAMFQDSPAYSGGSGRTSLLDVLQGARQESWWSKRKPAVLLRATNNMGTNESAIAEYIEMLTSENPPEISILYQIAKFSFDNPVLDSAPTSPCGGPASPSPFDSSRSIHSLHSDLWKTDKNFERLLNNLLGQLISSENAEILEAGLVVVSALIENQFPYLEGKEAQLFSMLLRIRFCNQVNVLEATNAVRDMLTSKLEPVYGLTTMHASLKEFYAAELPSLDHSDVKAAAYAFGLIALGKFILRLPAEVAEEELPRLRSTLISALNDKSSLIIRESAAACIIAAQLVLRDETHLFALLDGLADDKKNLLTYLFDKHGARGTAVPGGLSAFDKLEKEIRRLDTRTSTPSRKVGA